MQRQPKIRNDASNERNPDHYTWHNEETKTYIPHALAGIILDAKYIIHEAWFSVCAPGSGGGGGGGGNCGGQPTFPPLCVSAKPEVQGNFPPTCLQLVKHDPSVRFAVVFASPTLSLHFWHSCTVASLRTLALWPSKACFYIYFCEVGLKLCHGWRALSVGFTVLWWCVWMWCGRMQVEVCLGGVWVNDSGGVMTVVV